MIYLALTELALIAVLVTAFAGLLRSMTRAHARERDLLLNQVLHLSGRTWQPPPVDNGPPPEPQPQRFDRTPELTPDF